MSRFVVAPCLACGAKCEPEALYSGAVGPFCTVKCRDKNEDREVWVRATGYASRLAEHVRSGRKLETSEPSGFEESDVARAFVIGYAAGLEAGHSAAGRRTVKK